MSHRTNARNTAHGLIPSRNMSCVDRRRTIVVRQLVVLTNFVALQVNPHLIERSEPSLCTFAHAFPVLDFLFDKRWVHAIWDFVHGDIAAVEGLRPIDISVYGDVIDTWETVVGDGRNGDALAAVGLDIKFVGGLAGATVAFRVGFLFRGGTFRIEMRPNACRCGG